MSSKQNNAWSELKNLDIFHKIIHNVFIKSKTSLTRSALEKWFFYFNGRRHKHIRSTSYKGLFCQHTFSVWYVSVFGGFPDLWFHLSIGHINQCLNISYLKKTCTDLCNIWMYRNNTASDISEDNLGNLCPWKFLWLKAVLLSTRLS